MGLNSRQRINLTEVHGLPNIGKADVVKTAIVGDALTIDAGVMAKKIHLDIPFASISGYGSSTAYTTSGKPRRILWIVHSHGLLVFQNFAQNNGVEEFMARMSELPVHLGGEEDAFDAIEQYSLYRRRLDSGEELEAKTASKEYERQRRADSLQRKTDSLELTGEMLEDVGSIAATTNVRFSFEDDALCISNNAGLLVRLPYEKILSAERRYESRVVEKNKNVIGRAVVGRVFGKTGAIVGGMSGTGTTRKTTADEYLVITYRPTAEDEIRVISAKLFFNLKSPASYSPKRFTQELMVKARAASGPPEAITL